MISIMSDKRRGVLRLLFLYLPLLAGLTGCSLPEAPGDYTWDAELQIPMGVRTYGLWDLIDPDSTIRNQGWGIGQGEDSLLYFATYTDLTTPLGDSLSLDPFGYELERPLTALLIPVGADVHQTVSLGTLNPDVAELHGTTQETGPHNLSCSRTVFLGEDIDSLTVDTGSVTIGIISSLPYLLDNLTVTVEDINGASQTVLEIAEIQPDQSYNERASLHGISLPPSPRFHVEATGRGDVSWTVDSTRGFVLDFVIDTLQASEYGGIIPGQFISSDTSYVLEGQHLIELGVVDTGTLHIAAYNETQLDDSFRIVFPQISDPIGNTIVIEAFIPAGGVFDSTYDMHRYRIEPDAGEPQFLQMEMHTRSAVTPDRRVFVPGAERVGGTAEISRLVFDFFEGTLIDLVLPLPEHGSAVDPLPEGWEALHPTRADLFFHIGPAMEAIVQGAVELETLRDGSGIWQTIVDLPAVDLSEDTTLSYPDAGTGFVSEYPDSVRAHGQLTINGDVETSNNSTIPVAVELRAPLSFTLDETHPPGKIEKIETLDLEDIQSANVRIRVWNRLPLTGEIFVVVAKDSLNVVQDSGLEADTIARAVIPVSLIENGRAVDEAYHEVSVELAESVVDLFREGPFFTRTDVHLPGSGQDTLAAHVTDYMRVQVIADVLYRLTTEEDE